MDLTKAMELFEEIKRRLQDNQSDFSEFRTRIILIDPVLRLLGWDVENPDLVVLEYQPNESNRNSADYVLKNDEGNVAIVEAKNIDIDIEDLKYRSQADNYARDAGAEFFVLTNGVRWLLYKRNLRTSFESLKPIVSFDIIHDPPHQCALDAISMWRLNLASDGGPSKVTEPVLISPDPAHDQPSSRPDEQPEQQSSNDSKNGDKRYPFTLEPRYPPNIKPSWLKIGNDIDEEVKSWKDVIHEVVTWLINKGKLSDQHCPILIGKRVKWTFIDRKEAVNPDGSTFEQPKPLPNSLVLQRGHPSLTS